MIHIRDEGQVMQSGFNFYPLKSKQAGFVFKLGGFALTARYNKLFKEFKFRIRKV